VTLPSGEDIATARRRARWIAINIECVTCIAVPIYAFVHGHPAQKGFHSMRISYVLAPIRLVSSHFAPTDKQDVRELLQGFHTYLERWFRAFTLPGHVVRSLPLHGDARSSGGNLRLCSLRGVHVLNTWSSVAGVPSGTPRLSSCTFCHVV
jgi:hypothetical protein